MKKLIFNKNSHINFLNKKKFLIFKIKNFLDDESYNFIDKSFPKIDNDLLSRFDLKENNYKYTVTSKDDGYGDLIKNNKNLNIIHDFVFSNEFFQFFYENLKKEFFMSRMTDLNFFIKLLKPKILNKSDNYFKNFLCTHIKRQIEYSYIFNKGKIVPHTDSRFKLLSLLLFFPEGRKGEDQLGTTFWNSDIKNLNNIHMKNLKDENNFKKDSKVITKLDYRKYHLYGFIRNEKSWHSLEQFDLGEGYIRRSLNINFYF